MKMQVGQKVILAIFTIKTMYSNTCRGHVVSIRSNFIGEWKLGYLQVSLPNQTSHSITKKLTL